MLTTPFFLTFTSTWWYWQIDGLHIFEIYNHPAIGVMWSLATEAFFYAAYPLLAPMAARLSLHRSILSIGLAGALAAATALGLFFSAMKLPPMQRSISTSQTRVNSSSG